MEQKTILLIDDNDLLCRSLSFHLQEAGYQVSIAQSAEEGIEILKHTPVDLILLDIVLPGIDGLEALRTIRKDRQVPVIFLTGKRREMDELLGLELGGDDYITKPFDLDLLLARIKVVLRRASPLPNIPARPKVIEVGDLHIDPARHLVKVADRQVDLAPRVFKLLVTLASEPRRSFSIDELIARVWGEEYNGEPQVVYVHIRWLREKIEEDYHHPRRIITERGFGYRLEPQPALEGIYASDST